MLRLFLSSPDGTGFGARNLFAVRFVPLVRREG